MATLVCFHAHPDDEAIATAGVMARAAAEGHRVVLVVATRGERGEVVPGVLGDDEQLGLRRTEEVYAAAEVLGVSRVEFLGYVDSAMMGEPENDWPGSFWRADVARAANRFGQILAEESADLVTIYDENGGYGHPDHIQVHRVGLRAARTHGVRTVMSTINRDHIVRAIQEGIETGRIDPDEFDGPDPDDHGFGQPEARITHGIDVRDHLEAKRAAMAAHASQIGPEHFLLTMDDEGFAAAMGTEWFIDTQGDRNGQALLVDLPL